MNQLESTKLEGLNIEAITASSAIELRFSGSSDSASIAGLETFLGKVHSEATRTATKNVIVNCESLYFMNSSSVKCFVSWLLLIKGGPPNQRYLVCIRTNPRLPWQQRTFGSIQRSAPDVLRLE